MQCRNRLWKPQHTSKKHPELERAGDIKVLDRFGKIKQIIPINIIIPSTILPKPEPDENQQERQGERYVEWRSAVVSRDLRKCVLCDSRQHIQAHHIARWADDEARRYDLRNGVALCAECHNKHHGPQMRPFPDEVTAKLQEYIKGIYGG